MSSTEDRRAADIFFADLLLPLRQANIRRRVNYLDRGPPRQSYWSKVASRTGGMEELPAACDVRTLLDMLGSYWVRRNEATLLQLLPHLEALHQQLTGAAAKNPQPEPPLTEFMYPLA
jgi:hypothetical protein